MAARAFLSVLFLLALACASRLQGDVTYDPKIDYSRYKTFAFTDNGFDDANHQFARAEIKSMLESRGRTAAALDRADVRVDVRIGTHAKMRVSGDNVRGTDAGMVIQVIDASNADVVWYGWASETWQESMDPQQEITKAVQYVFGLYPPPSS